MNKHYWIRRSATAGVAMAMTGIGLVVATGTSAGAGTPTAVPLNPPPPDSYTCTPVGNGTRCLSDTTTVLDPAPSGIFCGAGADSFEVVDQGTRRVKAERWYDVDGNLVKRVRANLFSDTRLTHPVTGAAVGYDQHDVDTEVLAVPGDLNSATTYSVESLVAVAPGFGTVLVNKGRSVYGPDGSVISRTGRRDFDAYFGGDTSVVAGLCVALGG
jgi:hypothetical protein